MRNKKWMLKLGLILIIVSIPLFLFLPAIPFLDLDNKAKATLSLAILITAEILFWSGGILVGKELFTKYKEKLNPKNWFKKKETPPEKP